MTPQQAAVDVTNAYEAKDRVAHTSAVARLVQMVSLGPYVDRLTPAQLEVRRAELQGQINRVNDCLARHEREQSLRYAAERDAFLKAEAARHPTPDASLG